MAQIASVLDRFGSVREAAAALQRPPSTIQSWKKVGRIPAAAQPAVLAAAREKQIVISAEDLIPDQAIAAA